MIKEQRNDKKNKEGDVQCNQNSHKALALCVVFLASVTLCLKLPQSASFLANQDAD